MLERIKIEVELDIFSGMPNPTWVLTDVEADSFVKQLSALPRTPARELSGNLGYRGFIVQMTQEAHLRVVHVQAGAVQIQEGASITYASDKDRTFERWLLHAGKPHLKPDVLQVVVREIEK